MSHPAAPTIARLYDDLPEHGPGELIEVLVRSEQVRSERIRSRGHRAPPAVRHRAGGAPGAAPSAGGAAMKVPWPCDLRVLILLATVLLLAGCATLSPYPERPTVSVTSFSLAPESSGLAPRFRVGLQVVNPNRRELPLVGMSYAVELEGTRILSGAAADLPVVPAYGSADFTVDLTPDLLGSARLLTDLMGRQRDQLDYRFSARLDVGGWMPDIRVEQRGELKLATQRRD